MTKVKEILDKVRESLDEETRQKVGTLLKEIESETNDIYESLSAVKQESIRRKEKLREIMPKIEEYEDKISDLEKKTDKTELQQKIDNLTSELNVFRGQQRDAFKNNFVKILSHPKFEKVKEKFVLPEIKENEQVDFSKISDEDMNKNVSSLNYLNSIEYFETIEPENPRPVDGHRFSPLPRDEKVEIKSPNDLRSHLRKTLDAETSKKI